MVHSRFRGEFGLLLYHGKFRVYILALYKCNFCRKEQRVMNFNGGG